MSLRPEETNSGVRTSIHDVVRLHLSPSCSSLLLVYPIRLVPVLLRDEAEGNRTRDGTAHLPVAMVRASSIMHGAATTYSLNSSEKATSFRKTQGYPNRLLKRSSSCLTLDKALSSSELRTSMRRTAFARRVAFVPWSYSEVETVGVGEEDDDARVVVEVVMDAVAFRSVISTKDPFPVGHRNTRIVMLYSGRRCRRRVCRENYVINRVK